MNRGRPHHQFIGRTGILIVVLCSVASVSLAQTFSTDVLAPDGTHLATDVYLPISFPRFSTVLIRSPYDKEDVNSICLAVNLLGFACVAQDTRGRYASEGEDTVFRDDGADGRAAVDWIERQWWSDEAICTFGPSALGITQYLMAPGSGSEPRCMVPMVATPDLYHHTMFQGGALREALATGWLAGQDAGDFLDQLRQHRVRDQWWDPLDAISDPSSVQAAMLHIGGWYDIFLQGNLDAFTAYQEHGGEGARGQQALVIGPWTHKSGPVPTIGELIYPINATIDLISLAAEWLEHWLDGPDSDVAAWPAVQVYLMGASEPGAPGNYWLDLPHWPPPSTNQAWHLGEHGNLSLSSALPGELPLAINPADPVPSLGGANLFDDLEVAGRSLGAGPMDQRTIEARPDVLVFTSEALTEPVTVLGRLTARIWIRADTTDLDLSVRLTDVYPDGRSMLVTDGLQRARMRCGDQRECLLEPGRPTEIEVDLWSTALVFAPGHRIRLAVAGSNWPRFEVNPNDGGPIDSGHPTGARPALLFGPEHPSAMILPVIKGPRTPGDRHGNLPVRRHQKQVSKAGQ